MLYKTRQDIQDEKDLISPPGHTLLETINAHGITQAELARRMGRPLKTINEIIKGKAAITPETAIQLEHVLGISSEFWMERERRYRLKLAEIAEAEQMLDDADWLKNFPLLKMKKLGWLDFENNTVSKAKAIYGFFGVSGRQQYDSCYHERVMQPHYRLGKSGKEKTLDGFAVSAWLRQGERQAAAVKVADYDAKAFRAALSDAKKLMVAQPTGFFADLQEYCATAGVKLVHTPCIPGTPMHGATYWMGSNPVIQLSDNYKRNDIFWFNFFHEAGHIMLHNRKDVFVEGLSYSSEQQIKEDEANEFAANFLLTKEQEAAFLASPSHSRASVLAYAREWETLPGAIWGRYARSNKELNIQGWKSKLFQKLEL